jgi:hypothetical protein
MVFGATPEVLGASAETTKRCFGLFAMRRQFDDTIFSDEASSTRVTTYPHILRADDNCKKSDVAAKARCRRSVGLVELGACRKF